jgi:hypothetical protein
MRDLVRVMVRGADEAPARTWASAAALVCGRVPTHTAVRGFFSVSADTAGTAGQLPGGPARGQLLARPAVPRNFKGGG